MFNITAKDLKTFEKQLIEAARNRSEIEVNLCNKQRGYILFENWHPTFDDVTPEQFASATISLIIDQVDCIAAL